MWRELEWMAGASRRRRYLVGVSGGADSVALLHLLARAGFRRVVVCHLDHGLRGRASAADARFVGQLAAGLGFEHESARVDLRQRDAGQSVETAGRQARHQFFAACGRRWRCRRLLLAHHRDDQAETVLWNLLRGSRGIRGMSESQAIEMGGRAMEVIRPLLGVRREALRAWLRREGLKWREDASNAEPVAVRNRLRNEALPLLAAIARREVVDSLARAADGGRELREVEAWAVGEAAAVDPQGRLHVARLRELPEALRRACVHAYLTDQGVAEVDRATVLRVLGLLEAGAPARVTLARGRHARRRQGRVWVE